MFSKKIVAFSTGIVLSFSAAAQAFALSPITVEKQVSANADGSIKVDLTYDYSEISAASKIGATAVAAVYDETGVLKEVKTENLTPASSSSDFSVNVAKTPGYKVKTFLWKSSNIEPLALSSEFSEEELAAALPVEEKVVYSWDFEDGTGVAADGSDVNTPDWTYGTALWNSANKTFESYEGGLPVIKNISDIAVTAAGNRSDTDYSKKGGTDYPSADSTKCLEFSLNPGGNKQTIAAIRVKLSNTQLVPGNTYKVSMYTKSSSGTRPIYSALLPYTTCYGIDDNYGSDAISETAATANISWANYRTASPVAYSNCYWTPYEFVIEPKAEDFDGDGYTNLWLAYTREFSDWNLISDIYWSDGTLDKYWIDDIKITEYNETHPLEWNFENAGNDIGEGSELGKWVSAASTNTGNSATSRMLPIEQSVLISGNESTNSTGPAPDSTKCLKLSTDGQWCEKIGVKVKVSKDQLVPGKTYNMSMYTLTALPDSSNIWSSIYATLQPTTTTSNLGLYYEKNGSIIPGVFTGRNSSGNATGRQAGFGVARPYWYKLETTLTPQESDFDRNGYAYLWLTCTHSDFYNKEGKDQKLAQYEDIYIDDISITEVITSGEEVAASANN